MSTEGHWADVIGAFIFSGVGAMVGTFFKFIRHPPKSLWLGVGQATCAIGLGTLIGGAIHEWFHVGEWLTASSASTAAYISNDIFRIMDRRGEAIANKGVDLVVGKQN